MPIPKLLPTTVVGSYPPPSWLVDWDRLRKTVVRTRAPELWRIPEPYLEEAQDDATRLAVRDMEDAGIDIVSDGEIRRESYGTRFVLALEGVDSETPGEVVSRSGKPAYVPRVIGPIRRREAVEVRDAEFLRRITRRGTRSPCPAPSP